MAMFRTLFMVCGILLAAMSLSAQTTWYVRANGAAGNTGLAANNAFREIADITALADGDVIDIGAGTFAGANIAVSVTISGSNAGFAGFTQAATNLGQITLTGNDKTLTIEGVRWSGGVVPVSVTGTEAIVTISNSKFDEAGAITATAANWNELLISASSFDGDIDGGVAPIANAIVATGLDILSVTENTIRDYTQTAVIVNGANASVTIKNNDFIGNNSSGGANLAAVSYEGSTAAGAVADILNNRFDANKNGLISSGTLTSLMVARYNMFSNTVVGFHAIKRLTGTGALVASCNAYGTSAAASTVRGLIDGSITALPYNFAGTDQFPATVGFDPVVAEQCAADGPVRSSTTEGAGTSYFTISEAITASASGATVRIGRDVYNENLSINKRLYLFAYTDQPAWADKALDTATDGRTRTSWVDITGTVTITSAADTVLIKGLKFRRPSSSGSTNVNLLTSNASKFTLLRNCYFDVSSGTTLTSVPSNGVIHSVRAGDLIVENCHVTRPGSDKFARAITFASGNGCREVNIVNNNLYGTVQISGLSALSNVYIRNNYIENAGVDGVAVTGNYARTLNIIYNTIDQSQENGVAIRNGASVGANVANIQNNLITNSGKSNGSSSFAAINIGSQTTSGENVFYTNNLLGTQHGSSLAFINGRSTYVATATCNWWGNISEDVILTRLGGVGITHYDNGSTGWLSSSGNSRTGSGINGFEATGTCSVRSFNITLNTTNISCNNSNDGSIAASISAGSVQSYLWSNSATTSSISGLSANAYSVTITSTTGNIRSKSDDVYNPTVITADVNKTNITCFTATDGTITVSNAAGGTHADIAGGSRTFHYSLKQSGTGTVVRAPSTTSAFTGLDVGVYEVYVTALATTNGTSVNPACETKIGTTYEVTRPAAVTSNITGTTTICTGGSTDLTIAFNGFAPFTFKINDGASQTAPSSPHTVTVAPSATTTYTVTSVTDANGCSALEADRTGSAIVTLNTVTAGVIGSDQTICSGDNAAAFTVQTAASGAGTLTYQWQVSTSFPTPSWSSISGATDATFDEGALTADAQYRRITTSTLNTVACSAVSNVVTVTVNNLTAGSITGDQTICSGGDPAAFGSTAASGDSPITYQWQQNTSFPTASWSNISGATSETYDQGTLTADAQYRRIATSTLNSIACSAVSNVVTVTVNNLTAGVMGTDQTICSGGDPVAFTVVTAPEADGTLTYQWQVNTNLTTPSWSNITGATDATYDAAALTADAQYRRIATSTLNTVACSAVSNVVTVTVINLSAGSVGSDQTICYNSDPAPFTSIAAASGDGTITYQWQSSGNGSTWTSISGATAVTYDVTSNLTATTYYRRVANASLNGVDCQAATSAITVTVPTAQLSASVVKTHITCFSATDGTITVSSPAGGYGTYETSINNSTWFDVSTATAKVFSGLSEGTYTVYLRDKAQPTCVVTIGNSAGGTDVIYRPSQLTFSTSVTHASCNGQADGVINVINPSGGTHPELPTQSYKFSLKNDGNTLVRAAQTSTQFASLPANLYYITIIADGVSPSCSREIGIIQVDGPGDAITATVTKTNITCNGSVNGSIDVSGATGGTSLLVPVRDYRYSIVKNGTTTTGPQVSGSFTGLGAGTYDVYVTALASGNTPACQALVSTQIIYEPTTIASTTSKVNISKNGLSDAQISFTGATGGTHTDATSRTFSYYIVKDGTTTTGPQSSGSFTGLGAGTYTTFVIAAASGSTPACTTQVTSQTIFEPSVVSASVASTNISCNGTIDGAISVTGAAGGTHAETSSPRDFQYTVSRSGGSTVGPQASGSFTGLTAGTYTVSVTALADGATNPASTTVLTSTLEVYEPSAVTTTSPVTSSNPTCFGGTNGTIDVIGGTGGTHGGRGSRTYTYLIVKSGGAAIPTQTNPLFTGLSIGTYNVFVIADAVTNNPVCTTYVDQKILTQPPAVTHSMVDNANTTAPYIRTGGTLTFTITAQGGTPKTHSSPSTTEPHYTVTWSSKPSGVTADPTFVSSTNSSGVYTMIYSITGVDPDLASGTYAVNITDLNSCPSANNGAVSTVANVYSTVDLYVDNINGSNADGTGTSQRPLSTITQAIDIASANETINILQNSSGSPSPVLINEAPDGPIITKPLAFKRIGYSYDAGAAVGSRYSGLSQLSLEPSFAVGQAFVLGTTSAAFEGFSVSSLYVNTSGTIQFAVDTIGTGGTVRLLAGTWNLGSPISISKQLTLTGSPTNLSSENCDIAPTSLLVVAGSTKMMLFTGSTTKTVRNLDLTVGTDGTNTGRFFEVMSQSSGNVNVSNVIYRYNNGTTTARLFGITNDDRSLGVLTDVAKFVNDVADNSTAYGSGRVTYGEQGPLPYTNLEIGWKAEDASTATDGAGIGQLWPMFGTLQLRPGPSTSRPVWRNAANGLGGRAALSFNSGHFVTASATANLISGGAKSVFVAFKTPTDNIAADVVQILYKHGNHENGVSIALVGSGAASTELVRLSIYSKATGGTQYARTREFVVDRGTDYIGQIYFDGASGVSGNRVGMSLDNNGGQVGETKWLEADFNTTTLASPALSSATNISLGAKNGSVRWSDEVAGTAGNGTPDDYNNTAGLGNYFGGASGRIAEVLVYNTAAKTTRDAVYCYLRNKYLSSSTPSNGLERETPNDDVIAGGDVGFSDEIDIYPNPAETEVVVTVAAANAGRLKVELVDGLGRVISTIFDEPVVAKTILPLSVDVSNVANGMYMIHVTGSAGTNMSQPVVIRR